MKLLKLRNYSNCRYRANYLRGSLCYYIFTNGTSKFKRLIYKEDSYENSKDLQGWVRP